MKEFKHNHLYIKTTSVDIAECKFVYTFFKRLESVIQNYFTIMTSQYYEFKYGGHSGCLILGESHVNWHTFPENNFIIFDIYSCIDFNYNALLTNIEDNLKVKILEYDYKER